MRGLFMFAVYMYMNLRRTIPDANKSNADKKGD